jgi:hypothetical protein
MNRKVVRVERGEGAVLTRRLHQLLVRLCGFVYMREEQAKGFHRAAVVALMARPAGGVTEAARDIYSRQVWQLCSVAALKMWAVSARVCAYMAFPRAATSSAEEAIGNKAKM